MTEIAQTEAQRCEYDECFQSEFYLKYYSVETGPEQFFLKILHQAFESGKVRGDRILDVSCGPSSHRLGLASKYCQQLTYSDFSSQNRNLIQNWLDDETPETNQQRLYQYLAAIEGYGDVVEGGLEIEKRTKSKTTGVIRCDIHSPDSTLEPHQAPFDIVFSGAVLESACLSFNTYVPAIKNILSLLNPGGFFVYTGFTDGDFYQVGDIRFPCLDQSVEFVRRSLEEAGLKILDMQYMKLEDASKRQNITNCTGCFIAISQKP